MVKRIKPKLHPPCHNKTRGSNWPAIVSVDNVWIYARNVFAIMSAIASRIHFQPGYISRRTIATAKSVIYNSSTVWLFRSMRCWVPTAEGDIRQDQCAVTLKVPSPASGCCLDWWLSWLCSSHSSAIRGWLRRNLFCFRTPGYRPRSNSRLDCGRRVRWLNVWTRRYVSAFLL